MLKSDGDIWYMNNQKDPNLFYVIDWGNPLGRYYRQGAIVIEDVGNNY